MTRWKPTKETPTYADYLVKVALATKRMQEDSMAPPVKLPDEVPPHIQALNETPEAKKLREAWELHDKTMLLSDKDRAMADQAFEQARGRRPKK